MRNRLIGVDDGWAKAEELAQFLSEDKPVFHPLIRTSIELHLMKRPVTIPEASRITHIPASTLRRWCANGREDVVALKVGPRMWIVDLASLPDPHADPKALLDEIIEKYREDASWIDQVPYLVRTDVIKDLEALREAL